MTRDNDEYPRPFTTCDNDTAREVKKRRINSVDRLAHYRAMKKADLEKDFPFAFTRPRNARRINGKWRHGTQTRIIEGGPYDGHTVREAIMIFLKGVREKQPEGKLLVNQRQLAISLKVSATTMYRLLQELSDTEWAVESPPANRRVPPNIDYSNLTKLEAHKKAQDCGYRGSMITFMKWMKASGMWELAVGQGYHPRDPMADRRWVRVVKGGQ